MRPGFTTVVVLTLALGIGANTALFSVVHAVLLSPLPFRNPQHVVMLSEHSVTMDNGLVSPITYDDWLHRSEVFSELAAFRHWENRTIEVAGGDPEPVLHVTASANYFQVLGLQPLVGRAYGEEKSGGVNEAVLSSEIWRRRFASDPQVLGRTIRISGVPYVVVGVMPSAPHDLRIGWGDVWTPIHWYNLQDNRAASYRARYLRVLARLKSNVTLAQAQGRMDVLQHQLEQEATSVAKGYAVRVESLQDALVGKFRPALLVLLGAVGFVLLTACANVANLLLARGIAREKEIAIRVALGASRSGLVRAMLLESTVLASLGASLGLGLAYWGLWLLKYFLASSIPRISEAGLNLPVLLFTLFLIAVSVLLFSLAPMLGLGTGNVHETLKEAGRAGGGGLRRQRLRTLMVLAEFGFATLLLVCSGLLLKSFARLLQVHPGFELSQRVVADLVIPANRYDTPAKRTGFYRELLRRMAETPGVKAAGGELYFPCRSKLWLATVWREGVNEPRGEEPIVYWNLVAGDYFQAMGNPLKQGRLFTEREVWEPGNVTVINEAMARQLYPGVDPVGRRVSGGPNGPWNTIIGVVGDVRQRSLDEPPKPEIYYPFSQMTMPFLTVVAHTTLPDATALRVIRGLVQARDPDIVLSSLTPLSELAGATIATRRMAMVLLALFAALALVLSALGMYGVMSYAVSQRTPEIGIRMAIGAGPWDILRLITGQGLRTALSGAAVGLMGALAAGRALGTLLFDVNTADVTVYSAIAGVAVLVSVVSSYLPARRALGIDPLAALRKE